MKRLSKFWEDEAGANLLEYSLTLVLVSIGMITLIATLGTTIRDLFLYAAGSGS